MREEVNKYQIGDKFHFPSWLKFKHIDEYILEEIDPSKTSDAFKLRFLKCNAELDHNHRERFYLWLSYTSLNRATTYIKRKQFLKII